jgi:hypothetical protein
VRRARRDEEWLIIVERLMSTWPSSTIKKAGLDRAGSGQDLGATDLGFVRSVPKAEVDTVLDPDRVLDHHVRPQNRIQILAIGINRTESVVGALKLADANLRN